MPDYSKKANDLIKKFNESDNAAKKMFLDKKLEVICKEILQESSDSFEDALNKDKQKVLRDITKIRSIDKETIVTALIILKNPQENNINNMSMNEKLTWLFLFLNE